MSHDQPLSGPHDEAAGRPGDSGPETFGSQADRKAYVARFLPMLALMVAFGWLIVTLILNSIGVPLPALIALVPALGLGYYGYTFQVRRFEEVHAAATLHLSAEGVELVDANTTVRIAWADATRIGPGDMMGPLNVTLTDNVAVQAPSQAARASSQRSQDTLWGTGSLTVSPQASAMVRATVEQNLGGRDPQRTEVGTPLTKFDPAWREGRIGAWVQAYRPDLLV